MRVGVAYVLGFQCVASNLTHASIDGCLYSY